MALRYDPIGAKLSGAYVGLGQWALAGSGLAGSGHTTHVMVSLEPNRGSEGP